MSGSNPLNVMRSWPASFQYRHRAEHIAVDVGERILDTVTDPGLGAEMNHAFELFGGKQIRDRVAIRES